MSGAMSGVLQLCSYHDENTFDEVVKNLTAPPNFFLHKATIHGATFVARLVARQKLLSVWCIVTQSLVA